MLPQPAAGDLITMHMADALLSPAVGGTMWAAAAASLAYCSRKVKAEMDDSKIPLMGVMGAFVFATQMINFTIPGTGSSGHLGGGLLLAILLGPCAAYITLASVLTVQALFFADGGLLALGSNIVNLGLFPCFIAYPLIYRTVAAANPAPWRIGVAATLAGVAGLQLGSLGVVLETGLSGIVSLPFDAFLLLMQPIHLAIGLVEGAVTALVVIYLWKVRPELFSAQAHRPRALGRVLATLLLAAALIGGGLSWFASEHPDGLEWSIARATGAEELEAPDTGVHSSLARLQESSSILPDYNFNPEGDTAAGTGQAGTSLSGLVGGLFTLVLAGLAGLVLRRRRSSP